MLQVPRWRIIMVAIVTLVGLAFAFPNFIPADQRDDLPGFLGRGVNLGLDLQGGSQLLLEVDVESLRRQQLENIQDQMLSELRNAEPRINASRGGIADGAAIVRLNDASTSRDALRVLRAIAVSPTGGDDIIDFDSSDDGLIQARITDAYLGQLSRAAAQQSIEIIRRRIDPDGVAEVNIQRQGDRRIVVQAPGVSDPQLLKDRIGQTAQMTFHMVREVRPEDAALGRVPPGAMIVQPFPGLGGAPDVVQRRPEFTGERLRNARPSTDGNTGEFVLAFTLDSQGSRIFCRITREHTGERFAILLDNQVLTAPTINEPICGGSGQISGNFNAASASELALMLNAGALPAPLSIIEERTVDPTLGREAINSGVVASLLAVLVTVVFMLLAYGLFGFFACLALAVNMILLMAGMSLMGAALTLPGIAGLILTIAMAVDANVLIYERMREEAGNGRSPALAIDAGFNRAMITILDANLTTILSAFILMIFAGSGPVKGFAWTLTIGVVTSVFSAVLVTQIMIAWWFRAVRPKQMPI
jgi:protein-export membrane protein SecD